MATSTNSPIPIEKPEPSLGFSAQKKPVTSSTTGESSPDTPKVQSPFCSQSPDLEEAASAQPTPAKTSDPSGAGGDPMAASVASIAPHDSILSNKIAPTADNDDKATSPSQDVSPKDPDSPVTPPRSRGAPVSLSTQVEPQESPESPSGSQFTDSPNSCLTSASTLSSAPTYSISPEEMEVAEAELMKEWNATTDSAPLDRRLPLPPSVPNLFQYHDGRLSIALKALNEKGIRVVEYGLQILFRWGWNEVLGFAEWIVPDEYLELASRTVSELGYTLAAEPPTSNWPWEQWDTMGRFHDLDNYGSQLHLYPLTAVGIALEDTYEVLTTFDPKLRIRTPIPARYMLTMIRELLKVPPHHQNRRRILDDMAGFVHGYIFHGPPAETQYYTEEEEAAAEAEFLSKVEGAVQDVRKWDWGYVEDERYLDIAESIVRRVNSIEDITLSS